MYLKCIYGEKPGRKCWYKEGIQLCEVEAVNTEAENGYDHISIAVESEAEIMEKIKAYPMKAINDHWFSMPNGTRIELKPLANWKLNDWKTIVKNNACSIMHNMLKYTQGNRSQAAALFTEG